MAAEPMNPEVYAKMVVEKGGRVDFVFQDDRPFKECHASSIVETEPGQYLCVWFGGTEEKNPDVGIWLSRFADGAWSAPTQVVKTGQTAHWNPVLFNDPKRGIFLFFKVGVDVPHWSTWWMPLDAAGKPLAAASELVKGDVGGRGPVKNKAIIASDGAWLAPASTETPGKDGVWEPFADRSEDGGNTWIRSESFKIDKSEITGKGAIQPTFWEYAPGKIAALMRTTGGWVGRADSEDCGKTWTPMRKTSLPNNNSGIDAVLLDDGRVLLVYNPVSANWGARSPLTLAVSKDNGETWTDIANLENEPKKEFSYPAIVRAKDGVAISYTWKRERVRTWLVPLTAIP